MSPEAVSVEVRTREVERGVERLAKKAGVSIGFVCEDTMRLMLQDTMRHTPPPSLAAGRAAIAEDLESIFEPVDDPAALAAWRQTVIKAHGDAWTRTKRGKVKVTQRQLKAQTMSDMRTIHEQNRTRRGRVRRRGKVRANQIWGGEYIVPANLFRRYVRDTQRRVGKLMAHWAGPLAHWARRVGAPARIPQFVQRNGRHGRYGGRIIGGIGAIRSTNDLPQVGRHSVNRSWWGKMLRARQRGLARAGQRRVNDLAARFNAGVA